MKASAYMALIEENVEEHGELERLDEAAGRDPELDDVERMQVQERIGQYRGDEARRHADPDLGEYEEPADGDESEAA